MVYECKQSIESMYIWCLAKYLGNEGADSYVYMQQIIVNLLSIPDIKKEVIKDLGEDKFNHLINLALSHSELYNKVIFWRDYLKYTRISTEPNPYSDIIKTNKAKFIDNHIQELYIELAPIHYSLIQLFTVTILKTNLINKYVPSEKIFHAQSNKFPFRSEPKNQENSEDRR